MSKIATLNILILGLAGFAFARSSGDTFSRQNNLPSEVLTENPHTYGSEISPEKDEDGNDSAESRALYKVFLDEYNKFIKENANDKDIKQNFKEGKKNDKRKNGGLENDENNENEGNISNQSDEKTKDLHDYPVPKKEDQKKPKHSIINRSVHKKIDNQPENQHANDYDNDHKDGNNGKGNDNNTNQSHNHGQDSNDQNKIQPKFIQRQKERKDNNLRN